MLRGGTRKFWRCVVRSTRVQALLLGARREWGPRAAGVAPVHRQPDAVEQSQLVGANATKCRPAPGACDILSAFGRALQKNGLSSVLKSARWISAVPFGLRMP